MESKILEALINRVESGAISQRQVAERLGTHEATVSRILRGKQEAGSQFLASAEMLVKLMEVEAGLPWQNDELRTRAENLARNAGMTVAQFAVACVNLRGRQVLEEIEAEKKAVGLPAQPPTTQEATAGMLAAKAKASREVKTASSHLRKWKRHEQHGGRKPHNG